MGTTVTEDVVVPEQEFTLVPITVYTVVVVGVAVTVGPVVLLNPPGGAHE